MNIIAKKIYRNGKTYTQTIEEHGYHALTVYNKINNIYNMDSRIISIIKQCTKLDITEEVLQFVKDAIYEHDRGKINPEFQNKINGREVKSDSSHSMLSAYLYLVDKIDYIDNYYKNKRVNKALKNFAVQISYIISRHHSELIDYDYDMYFSQMQNYIGYKEINFDESTLYAISGNKNLYTLGRLVYSLMTTCDVVASYEFANTEIYSFARIDDYKIRDINTKFEENSIIKGIRDRSATSEINKIRSEIFIKSESRIDCNDNISFLDAQTGSGKTVTSLGIAKKLINNGSKRLIFTAPFKTILFQTENTIKNMISEDYIIKNEDTEIKIDGNNINYDRDILNDTLLNSNVVITSHIKLFDILFSTNKSSIMGLYGLMDSVVVLDEIQAYNNVKWIEIINMLGTYSKLFNIKFIIMSATLPKLNKLLTEDVKCNFILEDNEVEEYRNFFNKRVKCDFSMLEFNQTEDVYKIIDEKIGKHNDKKSFLIGLIKNDTSYAFYKRFKDLYKNFDVILLNSHTNAKARSMAINRINDINNPKKVIVIATQTIEAGVDISVDVGFKDFGILDSDIQFKGRIARHFEKEGIIYIFNYDNYKNIYREDLRKKYTLADKEGQEMFVTEDFRRVYDANFILLENRSIMNNIDKLCKYLQYKQVAESMRLIEQESVNILINTGEAIKLHDELKSSMNIYEFGKRKVEIRKKRIEMNDYILKYNIYKNDAVNLKYDELTDMYILDDYNAYMEDGKFGNVIYMNELRRDLKGLDMSKISNKKSKIVSTEDALKDVAPINWSQDILLGKRKIIVGREITK